jgi:uncharacterized membrane-anchored protein
MKQLIVLTLALLATFSLRAGDEDSLAAVKMIDSIESSFSYQTGEIKLSNGVAKLNIPQGFKFLNAEQSQYVLSNIWENPPNNKVLGMIFPENAGVLTRGNYVFVITYENDGHVKDDDAAKLDYDDLLKEIQSAEVEENKERQKLGYPTLHTAAWAARPFYDKTNKRLHWAKDITVGTEGRHALNYNVRILGREGILVLNAVAEMSELQLVKDDINKVLQIPSFTEGNKYSDYDSKIDKVAAYGIGGLIAGKVLAKVGFFAVILKFGKWILIGLVALGAAIFKFFKGKKKEEELVYQAPSDNQPIS